MRVGMGMGMGLEVGNKVPGMMDTGCTRREEPMTTRRSTLSRSLSSDKSNLPKR
jgi:hypothetical protein